jgi:hypothetical protein
VPWENAHLAISPIQCLSFACQAFRSARPGLLENARASLSQRRRSPVGKHAKRQRVSNTSASDAPNTAPDACHEGAGTLPGQEIKDVGPKPSYGQCAVALTECEAMLKAVHDIPASNTSQRCPEQPRVGSEHAPLGLSAAVIKPPAAAPKGCGFCPVCNRTFSFTFLGRHVESCLVSAADTAQPERQDALESSEPPSSPATFMDLTSSPGAPSTLLYKTCLLLRTFTHVLLSVACCLTCLPCSTFTVRRRNSATAVLEQLPLWQELGCRQREFLSCSIKNEAALPCQGT